MCDCIKKTHILSPKMVPRNQLKSKIKQLIESCKVETGKSLSIGLTFVSPTINALSNKTFPRLRLYFLQDSMYKFTKAPKMQ